MYYRYSAFIDSLNVVILYHKQDLYYIQVCETLLCYLVRLLIVYFNGVVFLYHVRDQFRSPVRVRYTLLRSHSVISFLFSGRCTGFLRSHRDVLYVSV